MKKRFFLFIISLKKCLRTIPVLLLTGVIIASSCIMLIGEMMPKDNSLVKVGICGETDNVYVRVGSVMLSETDTVEIVRYDNEKEAFEALCGMEIQGYAVIPEGFIQNALRGKNIPMQYYTLKTPANLSQGLTSEVVQLISPVVFNSQNAVFGAMDYLRETGNSDLTSDTSEELTALYVATLLQRDFLFEVTNAGISDAPDLISYYTVAVIFLFVLICGTVMTPRMIKKDMSLPVLLRWRGIGTTSQIICEWSAYSLIIYVFVILITQAFGQDFSYGMGLLPSVLLITAMQMLLFELSDSPVSGMLLHLFVSVILAYASGLIYPSYLLPEALRRIAAPLPVSQSFSLACKQLSGKADIWDSLSVMGIAALLLVFSVFIRRARIRRESI